MKPASSIIQSHRHTEPLSCAEADAGSEPQCATDPEDSVNVRCSLSSLGLGSVTSADTHRLWYYVSDVLSEAAKSVYTKLHGVTADFHPTSAVLDEATPFCEPSKQADIKSQQGASGSLTSTTESTTEASDSDVLSEKVPTATANVGSIATAGSISNVQRRRVKHVAPSSSLSTQFTAEKPSTLERQSTSDHGIHTGTDFGTRTEGDADHSLPCRDGGMSATPATAASHKLNANSIEFVPRASCNEASSVEGTQLRGEYLSSLLASPETLHDQHQLAKPCSKAGLNSVEHGNGSGSIFSSHEYSTDRNDTRINAHDVDCNRLWNSEFLTGQDEQSNADAENSPKFGFNGRDAACAAAELAGLYGFEEKRGNQEEPAGACGYGAVPGLHNALGGGGAFTDLTNGVIPGWSATAGAMPGATTVATGRGPKAVGVNDEFSRSSRDLDSARYNGWAIGRRDDDDSAAVHGGCAGASRPRTWTEQNDVQNCPWEDSVKENVRHGRTGSRVHVAWASDANAAMQFGPIA